jgi:hypothetical protein
LYTGGDGPRLLSKLRSYERIPKHNPTYTDPKTLSQNAQEIKDTYPLSHFSASPLTMDQQAMKDAEIVEGQKTYEERAKEGTRMKLV